MDEGQALIAFGALSQETRLRLLRLLVVAGPTGVAAGALAEGVDVSPSNVSFHLKELERAGLVESAPSAKDRRNRLLRLTPAGAARLAAALPAWRALHMAVEAALPDPVALREGLRSLSG